MQKITQEVSVDDLIEKKIHKNRVSGRPNSLANTRRGTSIKYQIQLNDGRILGL